MTGGLKSDQVSNMSVILLGGARIRGWDEGYGRSSDGVTLWGPLANSVMNCSADHWMGRNGQVGGE